jgi:GNAT superfamily N-acetyltransferase
VKLNKPTSELLAHLDRHCTELLAAEASGQPQCIPVNRDDLLATYAQDSPYRNVFVHIVDGQVVGHSVLIQYPHPTQAYRGILSAGVEAPFRGMGIGRALLSEALGYAREIALEYVDGSCLTANPVRLLDLSLGAREIAQIHDVMRVNGISHSLSVLVWDIEALGRRLSPPTVDGQPHMVE